MAVPPVAVDAACRVDRIADSEMSATLFGPSSLGSSAEARPDFAAAQAAIRQAATAAPDGWTEAWRLTAGAATDRWFALSGYAAMSNGVLCLAADPESEGEVVLREPVFPGDVRMEYTGWLAGTNASELSTFLAAGLDGEATGYLFQFGGKGNTRTGLVKRTPVETAASSLLRVQPGRAYRIVAEKSGGTVRLLVDGKEEIRYEDPAPLAGPDQGRIGFYTWNSRLYVTGLVVYTRPSSKTGL